MLIIGSATPRARTSTATGEPGRRVGPDVERVDRGLRVGDRDADPRGVDARDPPGGRAVAGSLGRVPASRRRARSGGSRSAARGSRSAAFPDSAVNERRFEVLRAIVADYVSHRGPVGVQGARRAAHLGVSRATVRNDMAALEEEGYMAQPHTSAGRIPTDKGYRLFVDQLSEVKPLSTAERRAIGTVPRRRRRPRRRLRRTVRLLAQLTRQVAVVQYPSLTRSTSVTSSCCRLSPARLMLVMITTPAGWTSASSTSATCSTTTASRGCGP